jgi:hypothetical protein
MKSAIEDHPAPGALSHDAPDLLLIAGDGVATAAITISDPRGAEASGKVIAFATAAPFLPMGVAPLVFDSLGKASVTFGPLMGSMRETSVTFYYKSREVDPTTLRLKIG